MTRFAATPRRFGYPTRRGVLTVGAAGAGLAAVGVSAALWPSNENVLSPTDGNGLNADHMQVIAHPDDDLFFNNLDIHNGIRYGVRQVTVCLTCGEADGFNGSDARSGGTPNFENYTAARYEGLRAAYGYMVTGDASTPWVRQKLVLPGGQVAEVATPRGDDTVRLVFLNMWVNGSLADEGIELGRLYHLWQKRSDGQPTMTVPDSPVTSSYVYSREDLVDALFALLQMVQPKVLRTMDPDPDQQTHDDDNPQYADQTGFSDSYDHTPTALFTWEAYLRWRQSAGGQRTVITSYRGYYNRRWPANLSASALAQKSTPIDVYGWNDHRVCGADYGCGDLNVPGIGATGGYGLSTILRYPERHDWAILGAEDRVCAVSMTGSRLMMWTETEPGSGAWRQPVPLHNEYLLPEATIAPAGDGVWSVQGIRPKFSSGNANHVRQIVRADLPGRPSMAYWESLGNPTDNERDPVERRGVGQPIFLRQGDRRYVFARNFDRRFSYRVSVDGGEWAPWKAVSGPKAQDGLAAIGGDDGSVHVFAAGVKGIVHWTLGTSGGWSHKTLDGFVPASAPSTAKLVDDRLVVVAREAESAEVGAYVLYSDGHYADGGARMLGGDTGTGAVALLPWRNRTVGVTMAIRTDSGQISFAEWAVDDDEFAWSQPEGPVCVGLPALVFDVNDRATALAMTQEAVLFAARQGQDGTGPITNWAEAVH